MKTLKTRIVSMILVLVTMLTLLPTAAFAASSTGTGIKPTGDNNYWTTRLLQDGTPYSYRPPTAAGKVLYCMDRGYGYRWGTDSFLNSYTYVYATGADADTVLETALAESGLGELDAQQLENVKWMLTYIVDYTGEIPGSLFMAAQTYIWDHQTYKGGGDGDIDAGGYANADTYDTYMGFIDWMLARKAMEDAEFQRQIEEYAEQGIVATVVEDESVKWAVLAQSSVKGRQAFFNYYAPRKLQVGGAPLPEEPEEPDEPDEPVGGDVTITLSKVAAGSTKGLDGAKFNIYWNGQIVGSDVTANGGIIEVSDVTEGLWSFVETEAPSGYCADPTPISVYVRTTDGDKQYTVTAENYELPSMTICKTDAQTGAAIQGAVFSVKSVTGNFSTSVTTGADGSATLDGLPAGVYVVKEESVPEPYIVSNTEQTVALRPGKDSEVRFQDYQKPGLEILKKNIADGTPIEGVTYKIRQIDGSYSTTATTDKAGRIFLENIPVGSYEIAESNVPSNVILSEVPQTVALEAGCTRTVTFFNAMKPSLTILKQNSVTGDVLAGAKFHVYYGSDNTTTGEINDLGVFTTDESGKIVLTDVNRGWYKLVEEFAPTGFGIKGDGVTEFYLEANTSKAVTIDNIPLSALVVYKYDAKTGAALEGCRFELRYLSGNTSGTGGTVIGTYTTGPNGAFTVTNLKKGTYICQEIASDGDHIIDREPQTVWISGEEQDVVTLRFGNAPKGALLVRKIDSVTREPLSDVEFFVTTADGTMVGDANGKFVTDSSGSFTISGITPGTTLVVKEIRAKNGYVLDDTPQTIQIKSGQTATLEFRNQPKGSLIIVKKDAVTGRALQGVEFTVTTSDGSFVANQEGQLSSNGLYYTDESGKIILSGLAPDTYVVTETAAIPGYVLDSTPQTVVVNTNDTQTLTFTNTPIGGLVIIKSDEDTGKRISGVQFEVRKMNGEIVGSYTTDRNGVIQLPELESGWYTVTELKAASGYLLDSTPQQVEVKDGQTATLELTNHKSSNILLHKIDAQTGKGIYGVVFLLYDSNHDPIAEYTTDQDGYIYMDEDLEDGRYYLREIRAADGYVLDTELKTVYVRYGATTEIEWANTAEYGQIQIIKRSADDNSINGLPAGTRLEGAVFEIYDKAGNTVDTIRTDKNGRAVSELLPLSRYTVREIAAPSYYSVNPTVMTAYLEYSGQIVTFGVEDESISLGTSIQKTGPVEAVSGQPIRYVFRNIQNTSTVPLHSFYWRDTLPAQVTLNRIVTGSYNQQFSYKVVYKTNLSTEYRTLADNLSTSRVYVLDARPAVLGLAANERVTEVMFVFGTVKAGFAQVETPYFYTTARSGLAGGSSIVNVVDVGGLYNGQWVQAVSRWLTTVYAQTVTTLPKTGY